MVLQRGPGGVRDPRRTDGQAGATTRPPRTSASGRGSCGSATGSRRRDGGVAGVRYPAGADHDHARVLAGELGERRGGARG